MSHKEKTEQPFPIKPRIWQSRLSWRIAFSVFLTILAVQIVITSFSANDYKDFILGQIVETSRSALIPLLKPASLDMSVAIANEQDALSVLRNTPINGFVVYRLDGRKVAEYGEIVTLTAGKSIPIKQALSNDWYYFEKVLFPSDLDRPYRVVVKMDTTRLRLMMRQYVLDAGLVVFLLSIFVTLVLMVLLSKRLLNPVIRLRNNLVQSAQDPENPKQYLTQSKTEDEIGIMIEAANNLIVNNAHYLEQLKSKARETIHQLAYYDTLTGLPNRTLFLQQLQKAIEAVSEQKDKMVAVAVVDLDHFKDINDSLGYHIGDQFLTAVGQRLKGSVPSNCPISRSGEDEFVLAVIVDKEDNAEDQLAEMVFNALKNPFSVMDETIQINGSVGVACYPRDGSDASKLLKNADIALNRAKQEGRDTIRSYTIDFDQDVQKRFQMVRELREAIEQEELQLYYQPQFELKTGELIGAEALIRWWKPDPTNKIDGIFISPGDFIPLAEQSGLIVPLGRWVINQACRQSKIWQSQKFHPVRIAVNISAIQFQQTDFVNYVRYVIEQTGIDPATLELEVTEGVFMDDINQTIHTLQRLNDLGIELAIDDFGTGYSSLSYLRQFPIHRLKIDQSFIRQLTTNEDDAVITKTIITLGHELDMKVMAEGVETADHEAFLKKHGCDEVQGYFYGRPMPVPDFEKFLFDQNGMKHGK